MREIYVQLPSEVHVRQILIFPDALCRQPYKQFHQSHNPDHLAKLAYAQNILCILAHPVPVESKDILSVPTV